MLVRSVKSLLVAVFSLSLLVSPLLLVAQEGEHHPTGAKEEEKLDPAKTIIEHVSDGHEFHFFETSGHSFSIPLPIILYSPEKGWTSFMSSKFHHGTEAHQGYVWITDHWRKHNPEIGELKGADGKYVYANEKIYALGADGKPDLNARLYDFSLTRNATQVIISVILLIMIMTSIAKKYKKGIGHTSAPKGFQNAVEPVITFVGYVINCFITVYRE